MSLIPVVELPPFHLERNRLFIEVETEDEFLADFEEYFWKVMHTERREVVIDLSRCRGMADDAFRMIALNMFEVGPGEKKITIRIPGNLERFFKHANLYRLADIEIVRLLGHEMLGDEASQPADAAVQKEVRDQVLQEIKEDLVHADPAVGAKAVNAKASDLQTLLRERFKQQIKAQTEARSAADLKERVAVAHATGEPGAAPGHALGMLVDRRKGQEVPILKNPTNLGRIPGNDILIAMPLVSKRHARIIIEPDGAYIEDLNSANGTYLNGLRLQGRQPLEDGARIQIAITSQYPNGAKEYIFRRAGS